MIRRAVVVVMALAVLTACSTTDDEEVATGLVDPSGARFVEAGTVPGPEIDWMPLTDLESVLRSADDIFVATLVGTERAVYTLGPDEEVEDFSDLRTEYDGLTVRVDDVLLGGLVAGDETTIAIPLATVRDGVAERWESTEHLDFVAGHVRALVESTETTQYLLFTVDRDDTKHVYGRVGIVVVDGDGAFLQMIAGSKFSAASPRRFTPPAGGWSVDAVRELIG